jgi:hypothetical protein
MKPTAKELIEAAKDVQAASHPIVFVQRSMGTVSAHILATVRPDDDEPVTRDAMAFEPDWRCDPLIHGVQEYLHKNGFSVVCDNGVFRFRGTVLQTMRKVRLVAALGE